MNINYWDCKFNDYEDYWEEGMEEEYKNYGCSNKENCTRQCVIDNKLGDDKAECPIAELSL